MGVSLVAEMTFCGFFHLLRKSAICSFHFGALSPQTAQSNLAEEGSFKCFTGLWPRNSKSPIPLPSPGTLKSLPIEDPYGPENIVSPNSLNGVSLAPKLVKM